MKRSHGPGSAARMEQAADWLLQLHDQTDDDVLERWLDWCAQDPRNQQAFNDISQVWAASTQVPAPPPQRLPPWAFAAGVAGLFALLLVAAAGWNTWWQPHGPAALLELVSPSGSNSRNELPDGSIIEVGGRSEAEVRYTGDRRLVRLRQGQIHATVSPDADRPFIVEAADLRIEAVGTAFDVLSEAGRSVVTVLEGQVDVRTVRSPGDAPDRDPVRLGAGQQLMHVAGDSASRVRRVDPAAATAWRSGILIFVDQPLTQVMAVINRYSDRPVVIEDARVGELIFTGTARTDRTADWLAALPDAFPVALASLPDGRVLLQRRPGQTQGPAAPP